MMLSCVFISAVGFRPWNYTRCAKKIYSSLYISLDFRPKVQHGVTHGTTIRCTVGHFTTIFPFKSSVAIYT